MEKLTIEQLRNRQMRILDYISSLCEENGLKYYLTYGTLIGAVRHKGYIPWDDDIDLFMLRDDYEKLIELVNADKSGRYRCFSLPEKVIGGGYYYPFVKISETETAAETDNLKPIEGLGVNVDIFALDYFNGKKSLKRKIKWQFYKLQSSLSVKFIGSRNGLRNFVKHFTYLIYKNKNPQKYGLKIDKLSQTCRNKTEKLFCGYTGEEFNTEWFGEGVILDFEDRKYRCPTNYDAVLRTCFGDYMQLPPEEDRVSHGENFYERTN